MNKTETKNSTKKQTNFWKVIIELKKLINI